VTAQTGSAQVGVKLSADQLAASFPFYVAFDDDLRVVQFGSGLAQLVPALAVGVPVHSALTLIQPTADWSMDRLRDSGDVPILVQVVGSDVHLVGPIVRIPDRPALFAYLAVRLRGAVPPQSTEPWNRQVSVVTAEGDSARPTTDSLKAENAELTQLNRALAQREWRLQAEIAQIRVRNAELEQTARELSNAQRVAEIGTWRYCIVEDRMEWSEELGRILDIKHGEFGTSLQSWLTLVHPADRARVESAVNARGPRDLDLDFRVIRRDGQRRYVHLRSRLDPDSNPPDYGSGTIQDVTDLRRTKKRCPRSAVKFANLPWSPPERITG
jgi:PAS domain-containing protein